MRKPPPAPSPAARPIQARSIPDSAEAKKIEAGVLADAVLQELRESIGSISLGTDISALAAKVNAARMKLQGLSFALGEKAKDLAADIESCDEELHRRIQEMTRRMN
jgi:hypothetical protein